MNMENNPNCKDGVCSIGNAEENTFDTEATANQSTEAPEASMEPKMVCKDGVCSIEAPVISSAPAVLDLSDFGIDTAEVDNNINADSPNSNSSADSPNCEGGVCSI